VGSNKVLTTGTKGAKKETKYHLKEGGARLQAARMAKFTVISADQAHPPV